MAETVANPGNSVLGLSHRRNVASSHPHQKRSSSGGRRLKTSMRARKVSRNMETGLKRQRDGSSRAETANGETHDDAESAASPPTAAAEDGVEKQDVTMPSVNPKHSASSERESSSSKGTDEGRSKVSSPAAKQASPSAATVEQSPRPDTPYRARPRQSYLSAVEDNQARNQTPSESEGKNTASGTKSRPPSIPQVPLFSSASKRDIQSLTSKKALKEESNPITHSTVGKTSMHYVTSSTGHQVQNRITAGGPSSDHGWWATRMAKLKKQFNSEGQETDIFKGISVYINGYVGTEIGNKELMRLLSLNGAAIHYLPNGSTTHIISAMPLSAKKRQEMLDKKTGRVKKFVKVEWALDSLEIKKRRPEHLYAHPIETQRGIADMFLPSPGKQVKGASTIPNVTQAKSNIPSTDWREAARAAAANIARPKGCS